MMNFILSFVNGVDNLYKILYYGGRTMKNHVYQAIFWGSKVCCAILCPSSKGFGVSPQKIFKIYMRKVLVPAFWMDLFLPKILLKSWWKAVLGYLFESQMPNYVSLIVALSREPNACKLHDHVILCPASRRVRGITPENFSNPYVKFGISLYFELE